MHIGGHNTTASSMKQTMLRDARFRFICSFVQKDVQIRTVSRDFLTILRVSTIIMLIHTPSCFKLWATGTAAMHNIHITLTGPTA